MTLRPFDAGADLEPLWRIFRDIIDEGATYVQDPSTTLDDFRTSWLGRGGEQWVAVHAGRVVGGYTLRPNHVGRGDHIGTASYIVDAGARGQGIGLALGTHSIDRARAMGFAGMQFNFVVRTNESAVRLWQRLGFGIVGTLPGVFRHRTLGLVDAYVMFRDLSARQAPPAP